MNDKIIKEICTLFITVTQEQYEAIRYIAARENKPIQQVVKDALNMLLIKRGEQKIFQGRNPKTKNDTDPMTVMIKNK